MKVLNVLMAFIAAVSCSAKVQHYSVEVVAEYPHDVTSYTQGLFFNEGRLYESTGLNGKSTFREVDLESGKAIRRLDFDKKYFVEGSVILGDELYVLTWTQKVAFTYSADSLEFKSAYPYALQGWGLTTDGESLIASDGTSTLYFMDGKFKTHKKLRVTLNDHPVRYLNELEWIDGKIWANVYTEDYIVIINPQNGKVEGIVDCNGLLPQSLRTSDTDVLNGIAFRDGRIFLTGKNWPRLYEIRLKKQ